MLTVNRLLCFRLHTAGLLVGWVGTVLSFIHAIIFGVLLIRSDDVVNYIVENKVSTASPEHIKTILTVVLAMYMTVNVVSLVSSVLLIAGTLKERHLMLVPWLINNGFVLAIQFILFAFSTIDMIASGAVDGNLILSLFGFTFILLFQYLIWTAIYSLYHHIRVQGEQQRLIPNQEKFPSYTRI